MNEYDTRMATQAEILLRKTEVMLDTIKEAQKYISDMNPSLAFKLWNNAELDLHVFHKLATDIKEEYGTPTKKD